MKPIKTLLSNSFLRASSLVYFSSQITNILNYVFNLIMGRILLPEQFGELAAIFSLSFILGVPAAAMTTILAKYVATKKSVDENQTIAAVYSFTTKKLLLISGVFLVIYLLITPFLSQFFKIPQQPLFVFGFLLPFSFLSALNCGFFQGLKSFGHFSVINFLTTAGKLIFGIILVRLGYGVTGAILAIVIASAIAYFYGLIAAKLVYFKQGGKPSLIYTWAGIFKRTTPVLLATLLLAVFGNVDLLLAKKFLLPLLAGQYAALSVVSKIISYGSLAITIVLIPTAATGKNKKLLLASIGIVSAICLPLFVIFSIWPSQIMSLLFGSTYSSVSSLLWIFSLTSLITAHYTIAINYFLAIGHNRFLFFLGLSVFLEIIFISFFHQNIFPIISANLLTSILLLVATSILAFRS